MKRGKIITKIIVLQNDDSDKHLGITHDNQRNGTTTLKQEIISMLNEDCRKSE